MILTIYDIFPPSFNIEVRLEIEFISDIYIYDIYEHSMGVLQHNRTDIFWSKSTYCIELIISSFQRLLCKFKSLNSVISSHLRKRLREDCAHISKWLITILLGLCILPSSLSLSFPIKCCGQLTAPSIVYSQGCRFYI